MNRAEYDRREAARNLIRAPSAQAAIAAEHRRRTAVTPPADDPIAAINFTRAIRTSFRWGLVCLVMAVVDTLLVPGAPANVKAPAKRAPKGQPARSAKRKPRCTRTQIEMVYEHINGRSSPTLAGTIVDALAHKIPRSGVFAALAQLTRTQRVTRYVVGVYRLYEGNRPNKSRS